MSDETASPSAQIREVLACAKLCDEDLVKVLGVDQETLATWKRRRTPLESGEGTRRLGILLDFVQSAKKFLGASQLEKWLTVSNPDMRNLIPLDRLMIEPARVERVFLLEVQPLVGAMLG